MKTLTNLFIRLLLLTAVTSAQWSSDPSLPQLMGTGVQSQVAPTSDGGVYIAWLTDGNYHVYIQRLDAAGEAQLDESGQLVSDNNNASWIAVYHLNLAVDGNDNAIITTVDQRTGTWEVYAWKIAPDGSMPWGQDGVALTNSGVGNMSPRLTILPDNSAVVTWTHNDNSVLFQRISSDGTLLWGDGILMEDDDADLMSPQPIITVEGDVLIQWIRQSGAFPWAMDSELYLQKYDYDGNPQWSDSILAAGPVVFPMGNWSQQLVAEASGGSFLAWTQMSGNVQNAVAQLISVEGVPVWTGGVDLSTNSSNFRMSPMISVAEETQELLAVWREANGSQSERGISAQRLDNSGNRLWGENGITVVDMNPDYDYLDLSVAGFGEEIISSYIQQSANMSGDIYAKRLDAEGNSVWTDETVTVTNSGTPKSDMMTSKGPNCLVIAWSENGSIYAHCLREDGTLGAPEIPVMQTFVPDDNFEQALIDLGYDDVLDDSVLTENISGIDSLNVSEKEIHDLTGIEDFVALEILDATYNELTTLDISNNIFLTVLGLGSNQLTSLDVSNNTALIELDCWGNTLTSLDVSQNSSLSFLGCGYNGLTSLDVSNNTALTLLWVPLNQLTSLDVTNNLLLTGLICNFNQLTNLDVSNNPSLTDLRCVDNELTNLDISNNINLSILFVSNWTYLGTNNQLTNLDVSNNPLLTDLRCGGIQLENLDVSNNPLLTGLRVGNNALTSLDVSNNTNLMTLVCFINLITDLDVGNNPLLTDLRCGDNELTSLDVSNNPALKILDVSNWYYGTGGDNEIFSLEISNNMLLETLGCANNQITGDLFEIVDLDSLTTLRIENNQFSGEIPETICDLNINFSDSLTFNISNNSFCPPYPSCVNDYIGEQDTTNCGQVSITDEIFPLIYKLQNAYPNPFNPVTTLSYDLPEDALVNVTIYDMVGRKVSTLISSRQSAGYKSIQWNATNSAGQPVSAGVYLYAIQAGEFRETKKMVLLK